MKTKLIQLLYLTLLTSIISCDNNDAQPIDLNELGRLIMATGDINSMKADGTDWISLTNTDDRLEFFNESGANPFSPDETRLVFNTKDQRTRLGGLFIMDLQNKQTTAVTDGTMSDRKPVWSPDGTKLAFLRSSRLSSSSPPDVYVINTDGTGLVKITNNPGEYYFLDWLDNDHVVFSPTITNQNLPLLVTESNGLGTPTALVPGFSSMAAFSSKLSRDKSRIAFRGDQEGTNTRGNFIYNFDNQQLIQLTGTEFIPKSISSWSPDDTKLLMVSHSVGGNLDSDVYLINADGSGLVNLSAEVDSENVVAWPTWSPDGSRVIFSALLETSFSSGVQYDLFMVEPSGSNLTNVTNTTEASELGFHWGTWK